MGYRTSRRVAEKEERIRAWADRPPAALPTGDIVALERAIHGQVMVPGDADYDLASRQANPAFVRRPRLVVYCETPGDVRQSLAFARRLDLAVRCRSGGHSTAGYSVADGCMVIDTSRMRYVHISGEGDGSVAHVGAGSDWGYVNSVLDSFGLHVPGGGCESVCVAGFMQGGGYGYTSRMYGMNCDNVAAVKVMLADGRILVADEGRNRPLFWAIRGGTGGNFGVLLEISYRLHRTGPLWGFGLRWRIEDAPQAIVTIQNGYMKTNRSRLIGCETHATTVGDRQMLLMRGIHRGGREEALEALGPALATTGVELEYGFEASYLELNRRHEDGVIGSVPADAKEDKQSGYLRAPMTLAEWEGVIELFRRTPNPYSVFNLEAYGGAINDYPAGGNAFVHRDAWCNFFLDVFWADEPERAHAQRFLDEFMALMRPYFDRPDGRPQANQDYPRGSQTDYLELYFPGIVRDLVTVKRLYDSGNFFRYEQSIPIDYPADAQVDPASPGFTGREEIVVAAP
ncbi:MAG: FAD-binding oxidoreductase [Geminicoccaceae bacterium]